MGYLVIADFFGDGGARYAFALSPKLRPLVVPYLPNQYKFHDRRRVIYACSHSVQDRPGSRQGARVLVLPLPHKATAYDKSTALEDWVWLRRVDRRSWDKRRAEHGLTRV